MNNSIKGNANAERANRRLAGAFGCLVVAVCFAGNADARRYNAYQFVPPPPPTPVLQVPPPPMLVPYPYDTMPVAIVPTDPKKDPKPQPRPMGSTGEGVVDGSVEFAKLMGFGSPRHAVDYGPGAAVASGRLDTTPVNPWLDESMRWYADHLDAQKQYNERQNRPEKRLKDSGIATGQIVPTVVAPARRAFHKVRVSR